MSDLRVLEATPRVLPERPPGAEETSPPPKGDVIWVLAPRGQNLPDGLTVHDLPSGSLTAAIAHELTAPGAHFLLVGPDDAFNALLTLAGGLQIPVRVYERTSLPAATQVAASGLLGVSPQDVEELARAARSETGRASRPIAGPRESDPDIEEAPSDD